MAHYPDLATALEGVCRTWCEANGYSEPFCRNGEWWAFPPAGVMPVKIKDVMEKDSQQQIRIGTLMLTLCPDGSLAREIECGSTEA
ncbi:MAG: hypothetical protein AAF609_04755 [Cyanobacteria bacterium P01_C01_bin.120]